MSKTRKLTPDAQKILGKIKKVGELTFLRMPDGKIAVTQLLDKDVPLADIIAALDQIQTHMIEAYEAIGPNTTGHDYINHNAAKESPKPD